MTFRTLTTFGTLIAFRTFTTLTTITTFTTFARPNSHKKTFLSLGLLQVMIVFNSLPVLKTI
jgi:hypothetical protein